MLSYLIAGKAGEKKKCGMHRHAEGSEKQTHGTVERLMGKHDKSKLHN